MKKKLLMLSPLLLSVLILAANLFYCSRPGSKGGLFGDSQQSPLKTSAEASKAFEIQENFRKIYDIYKDRVVSITTEQFVRVQPHPFFNDPMMRDFFGLGKEQSRVQKRTGLGTGFILSSDGYICTNHHVVNGVDSIIVTLNEKSYKARLVGSDEVIDIALLKIDSNEQFKPVYFGDSETVKVGDWAIAIGNPFGLEHTFTVGVISAVGRRTVDYGGGSHIQTDASINPGNSGGPLINIYGEVIGINRMIYSNSGGYMGIGFAVPVNVASSILAQLKDNKKIKRGYMGVTIIQLTEDYAKELGLPNNEGAFIGEVVSGSPAEKGGLLVGDVIITINDQKIKNYKDMIGFTNSKAVGEQLKIIVWRKRTAVTFYVRIAERPVK